MIQLLQNRSILRVNGADALKFLQSMTTNDLINNAHSYNYLLSPQGRYLYDFFVSKISDEELLIDVDSSGSGGLMQKLNLYKLRREVIIEDKSAEYGVMYSESKLEANDDIIVSYKDPRFHKLGFRAVVLAGNAKCDEAIPGGIRCNPPTGWDLKLFKMDSHLRGNDTEASGNDTLACNFTTLRPIFRSEDLYLQHKYQFAIPDGVTDLVFDRSIPSHFGAEELFGISFSKGCYIGQEVISRAKYQGVIRKKIYKITSGTKIALKPGADITDTYGDKIGILCSSHTNNGIVLLNEEKYLGLKEKIAIMEGGIKVEVEVPEWRKDL